MPINFNNSKLFSVKELTGILPFTRLTICVYLRKGKLKGHKIGKNWYVTKENLEAFLEGDRAIIKSGLKRFMKKTLKNLINIA